MPAVIKIHAEMRNRLCGGAIHLAISIAEPNLSAHQAFISHSGARLFGPTQ